MKAGRVEISPGFLLLAAWLNYVDQQGIFLCTMISCVVHELCHLVVLRLQGVPVRYLRLTAVGAEICVDGTMSYRGEMAAALAGPMGNLVLAWAASRIAGGWLFAGVNLALGLFNLIPIGRLDGGRFVCCLCSFLFGPEWGEWGSGMLSGVCLIALCGVGVWCFRQAGNLTLLLISLWMIGSLKDIPGYWGKRKK